MLKIFDNLEMHGRDGMELHTQLYASGNMPCLQLMAPMEEEPGMLEPYMTLTCNFPDEPREDNEIFIKDWTENEGSIGWLLSYGLIEAPHRFISSGFVSAPVCRMTPKLMLAIGDALIRQIDHQRGVA